MRATELSIKVLAEVALGGLSWCSRGGLACAGPHGDPVHDSAPGDLHPQENIGHLGHVTLRSRVLLRRSFSGNPQEVFVAMLREEAFLRRVHVAQSSIHKRLHEGVCREHLESEHVCEHLHGEGLPEEHIASTLEKIPANTLVLWKVSHIVPVKSSPCESSRHLKSREEIWCSRGYSSGG